jgi:hypothetical protein
MPGSREGGVIAPISLQKEGVAIPFPTPLSAPQLARPGKQNGAHTTSSLWYERRAPSVKGSWVNGAAPAGAHYFTKTMRILTD